MEKPFSRERLTFRLDILAQEAIRANDDIFQARAGLKVHEVRVLRIIGQHPGITFVELSRQARMERSLTSRIIQRLIKQELVRRENDPADARRFRLFTTPEGDAKREVARRLSDDLEQVLLAPLETTEAHQLDALLERLAAWIRSEAYEQKLAAFESGVDGEPGHQDGAMRGGSRGKPGSVD
ncbi:MarR family winged helix-turn-helix transcriptional regulator [Halomonas sp. SSL-5]|uniref:MarR family winged helix-turn-helix transcriptional regulator n=1 Tax=Halomonas sp. SSL-5 TaxID=3065855 RepID=UPI00273A1DA3|nr:MarR family winged helix-turn-helix transcriptional regulator [Halomonas sp. SSL-5]MDY7116258.1 MarR family winged helix-turn-helix transcriptional regulator [Halomonas sp. SSL-5]